MRDPYKTVVLLLLSGLLLFYCSACKSESIAGNEVVNIALPTPNITTTMSTATPSLSPLPAISPTPTGAAASTLAPTKPPAPSWPIKKFKYQPAGYTTAGNVNLREGPGTEYAILRKVDNHAVLTMLAESGDWYYVSIEGIEGFISKEYAKVGAFTTPKPSQKYSQDDIYMAAQMIYLEAKGGTYEEFQAIATVLANRIASRSFPNTIEENIFAPGQFTVADDREWFLSKKPSKAAIRAANSVLNDGEHTFEKQVMYFRAKSAGTQWRNRKYYETIGNHCFFE